ncbi:MAG: glycosyltransferase family 39 protein [Saprospiraceae bacterium]|nr:glycosyltransferase family 39 protein [Saprospiraceae bacterium]
MRRFWREHPLWSLLILGAAVRLLAAFCSAGYAMHDDHFLVVEVAQSWVDGRDVYGWITTTKETNTSGRSLFYPGIVAGLFQGLEWCGVEDPRLKTLILRLLQAAYSLLAVFYTYKLVLHWSDERRAREAGLLVALLWLMPYISVRTLAEVVCIPPLLAATWVLVGPRYQEKWYWALWAGVLIGIGFSLRYQTLLYGAGLGAALLWERRWLHALGFALGSAAWIAFMHGWVEWYVWGYPFGKIEYYIRYNLTYKDAYFQHPWYNYLLLLPALLFPIGLLYAWGVFRYGNRYLPMLLGFLFFLVFHSTMPNKQERFIFSIVPMFIALGAMGWGMWTARSEFWQRRQTLSRGLWAAFWLLNTIALLLFSTYYPKQGRVEAMLGMRNAEFGMRNGRSTLDTRHSTLDTRHSEWLVVADGRKEQPAPMPLFYTGRWPEVLYYGKNSTPDAFRAEMAEKGAAPCVILVLENDRTEAVVAGLQTVFPGMVWEGTHASNLLDRFLHWLNPLNRTESVRVYWVGN